MRGSGKYGWGVVRDHLDIDRVWEFAEAVGDGAIGGGWAGGVRNLGPEGVRDAVLGVV